MSTNQDQEGAKYQYKIESLIQPIRDDLMSGAAEQALRAITLYQALTAMVKDDSLDEAKETLIVASKALVDCQPAMAPLFQLANQVLLASDQANDVPTLIDKVDQALTAFEKRLCDSASKIADLAYDLIEPGGLVFAYSFSSTVVSCLLNARARGRYFRVVTTEARPSMEGRKLASRLAAGNIEVIYTFDNAMGLVLGNCCAAFMGCDCIASPGVVNKVGSWALAIACRELNVPLYAFSGTEKFVSDERMFEFEKHERPGNEVWDAAPKGVAVLNHQFDLVPFNLVSGLVSEDGILGESDVQKYASRIDVHEALRI